MEKKANNKKTLLTIFFTTFLDLLGFGLIIPVLAPMIVNNNSSIFAGIYSPEIRSVIYGILMASFPLAQFFSSPIIGGISDKIGRRKVLIMSIFVIIIGYISFSLGVHFHSLILLLLGRLIPGIGSGNIVIVFSAMADISDKKNKTKNFGLIGVAFGLGFILGPLVGSQLSNSHLVSWFDYATPFYAATLMSIINLIFALLYFPETLKMTSKVKISLMTGFTNISKAFNMPNLRTMFIIVFIYTFGFSFFTQFFPIVLINQYSFDEKQIGIIYGFLGLCVALSQGVLLRKMASIYSPRLLASYSLPLLGAAFLALVIPKESYYIYIIIPFLSVANSLAMPSLTTIISNLGTASDQGEILGINQSMSSLAQAIPPIIGGFLTISHYNLPIIFSAACAFLAWAIFMGNKKNIKDVKPTEINII
jgi:MFS transporter, DHA1 family, tetracycline resistance protein